MRCACLMIVGALTLLGCSKSAAPTATKKKNEPPPLMTVQPVAPPPAEIAPSAPPAEKAPPKELVEATVGVGKKGRSLDEHEGIIVTPVKSYFAAKEMAAFDILVPQALALYKATEGRAPKTHEEFWEKVITPNNLEQQLPELPKGHRYVYDPETEKLMVERPKASN